MMRNPLFRDFLALVATLPEEKRRLVFASLYSAEALEQNAIPRVIVDGEKAWEQKEMVKLFTKDLETSCRGVEEMNKKKI